MLIRQAQSSDLKTLLQFEQNIIAYERPFDITIKPNPVTYYDLNFFINSKDVHLLVAEKNKRLIACGYAQKEKAKDSLKHKYYAYLGFMYVEPEFRGQGLNAKIIDNLLKWCSQKNLTEIRLKVYDHNLSALKAYKKIGFTNHLIEMRKNMEL